MSTSSVRIEINGCLFEIRSGISVAAAIAQAGATFHRSVGGQPRAPLCGMGVCFECRVQIDGVAQQRACLRLVHDGMQVTTDD